MADDNSNTPNPRRKRPAPTIDLSATEVNAEPPPRASEDNKDTPHTDDTPRSRRPILLAVIAGGLGGAAAVVFGLWFAGLLAPHNSASDLSSRLAKLETQVSAAPKASGDLTLNELAARIGKLEQKPADTGLSERLTAIETSMKALGVTLTALNRRAEDSAAVASAAREHADAAAKAAANLQAKLDGIEQSA